MISIRRFIRLKDPLETTLLFALATPLLLVARDPIRATVGAGIVLVGVLARGLVRWPMFWFCLAGIYGTWFALEYSFADDHLALAVYWYLAIALALRTDRPVEFLRINSRLLIGATFAFAVTWKLKSPDFVSGQFFEYALVMDPRFTAIAKSLGLITDDSISTNLGALQAAPIAMTLASNSGIETLARVLTAGTLFIEPITALSWLGPRINSTVIPHVALATFCVMTYAIVPVAGFGAILLAIGVANADTVRGRTVYGVGLVALIAWAAIWNVLVF